MKSLVEEGRKYKSNESREVISIDHNIIDFLDKNQLIDIIDSLESNKRLPHKYFYLNGGSEYWNQFYNRSLKDSQYTASDSDLYYFNECYHLIKDNFKSFEKINVVDIGQGNGIPAISLLKNLVQDNMLCTYTAVDISPEMLKIAKTNIEAQVDGVNASFIKQDFENKSLKEVFNSVRYNNPKYPILVLGIGGTIYNRVNYLSTFFNIIEPMHKDDILCITNGISKSEQSNHKFTIDSIPEMYKLHTWLARKLGLTEDITNFELRYNEDNKLRELNLILKKDVELIFSNPKYKITLTKNDRINLWVHQKATFSSISILAEELNTNLKLIIKHPIFDNVMYMMSKK